MSYNLTNQKLYFYGKHSDCLGLNINVFQLNLVTKKKKKTETDKTGD